MARIRINSETQEQLGLTKSEDRQANCAHIPVEYRLLLELCFNFACTPCLAVTTHTQTHTS